MLTARRARTSKRVPTEAPNDSATAGLVVHDDTPHQVIVAPLG